MTQEELKNTSLWELYEKHLHFMSMKNIYTDTDINYRMFNGDQWYKLKIEGIEKIQHNFIKPIVKHKTTQITANGFAINYSPENINNSDFMPIAQKACDLLNSLASKVWDTDFMDKKIKRWSKDSAINDEAVCYVNYTNKMPKNERISKNDIMYGNENEDEIQFQPYILIRQRKTVLELQKMAKDLGLSQDEIESIRGDKDVATASGESSKYEVDDNVWLITKFYKVDDIVHFSQGTQYCMLQENVSTQINLYPIAHWNWEDQEGSARGIGEVRQLIPNQLETNKTAMRRALTVKNVAYPQKVIAEDLIQNPKDVGKVGSVIRFKGMGGTKASDVFMSTTPAQMSSDSEKLQSEIINYSRDLNNVSEATSGTINPESASGRAILAVQQAQNQPLTDQMTGLKSFVEDIARIWFAYWKADSSDLLIDVENVNNITGEVSITQENIPGYILESLSASVKVDVTPKGPFDKYAQELSLENLFSQDKISFEEYVESLDSDSVMPKVKLENIVKKRKDAQKQINQLDQQAMQIKQSTQSSLAQAQDIENISNIGNQMINQASM